MVGAYSNKTAETAQTSACSHVNSHNHMPVLQSQPSECSSQGHSMPQSNRSRTTTRGEMMWWLSESEQNYRCLHRQTSDYSKHTNPTWGKGPSAGRRKNTQSKQNQFEPDLQGFHFNNLGEEPAPNRVITATEQKGNPASHPAQTLDPL